MNLAADAHTGFNLDCAVEFTVGKIDWKTYSQLKIFFLTDNQNRIKRRGPQISFFLLHLLAQIVLVLHIITHGCQNGCLTFLRYHSLFSPGINIGIGNFFCFR